MKRIIQNFLLGTKLGIWIFNNLLTMSGRSKVIFGTLENKLSIYSDLTPEEIEKLKEVSELWNTLPLDVEIIFESMKE